MAFNPQNPNGQATMASSAPVVIASNQSAVPVTGTFFQATQPVSAVALPLPTGASTETTLAALNTKVTAVNTGAVTISAALPAGTNTIGAITVTGTGGIAATKASATTATTTDIAQVVALSPNSPAFLKAADLGVTVTAIAGAIATLTLPAPAA